MWEEIKAARPSLVIVDPVSAALADADTSQTGPARTFLRNLSQEAETAGCGVLVVAHDTKDAKIGEIRFRRRPRFARPVERVPRSARGGAPPPNWRRADGRLSETSATGLSDAAKAGEPAYPLGPRFAGPRQGLAGGCAPSDPPNGNGT